MDNQVISDLTEIALLVPTQSISIDILNAVYPSGQYVCHPVACSGGFIPSSRSKPTTGKGC